MKRGSAIALVCCTLTAWYVLAKDKPEPKIFRGGKSEISSDDPERAVRAIRKWTDPSAWDQEDPREAPYFWDFNSVGRPVFLRVIKNGNFSGNLEIWLEDPQSKRYKHYKTYRVAVHSGKPGPKMATGDLQAPEGFYYVNRGRMNSLSDFHLSMDIGYPNAFDRHHGRTGSALMIHGKAISTGCFAMTDASIEQIYTLVDAALKNGQPFVRVHCFPFPMTEAALENQKKSEHIEFWRNLKQGWDSFEQRKRPPNVEVQRGKYVFSNT